MKKHATLVGAGLTGPLLGLYLSRRGYSLDLYERRPDMRKVKISAGRSINLAISTRGIAALKEVGLANTILQEAIPMKGRMIHHLQGKMSFQPYGRHEAESIFAISRATLNKRLLDEVEKSPDVRVHFQEKVESINFQDGSLLLENQETGHKHRVNSSLVFGTDGSASGLRAQMAHELSSSPQAQFAKDELSHSYKELYIPPGKQGEFLMEKNALHIWPRGSFMLIALPNLDGSFTCTLFLDTSKDVTQGPSFSSLQGEKEVLELFQVYFSDALSLMPTLLQDFFHNPTGSLTTIKSFPWSYEDKALLIGDAAHAIVPFYGQGMNCCFEDCMVLNRCFEENPHWGSKEIFQRFQDLRKPNTDAIADMAVGNFLEMRDYTGNPHFLLRKEVEQYLMKKYPNSYLSQYFLVTFTQVPYSYAQKVGKSQEELLQELCSGIDQIGELNDEKVERAFQHYQQRIKRINLFSESWTD